MKGGFFARTAAILKLPDKFPEIDSRDAKVCEHKCMYNSLVDTFCNITIHFVILLLNIQVFSASNDET